MYIDFIIISYLINYGLVYSALYIKRSKLNLFPDAKSGKDGIEDGVCGDFPAGDGGKMMDTFAQVERDKV